MVTAACFAVVGQLVTWWQLDEPSAFSGPRGANAVLNLLLMALLAWRRRAPLVALCAAVGIYYLPHAIVQHDISLLAGFVPLIVLTASVATTALDVVRCSPQRLPWSVSSLSR